MKRRKFITGSAAILAAAPRAASAQQKRPVIGYISGIPRSARPHLYAAFASGLGKEGFVDGRNVEIEHRFVDNAPDRLPELAGELIRRGVSVIASTGSLAASMAAKRSTQTVPIVFTLAVDPVSAGLVSSLNKPGGNVTGVSILLGELTAKRVELLRELVPKAARIAVLSNPQSPESARIVKEAESAARLLGLQFELVAATTPLEIELAFGKIAERKLHAVLVTSDPLFNSHGDRIVALGARSAIPVSYGLREYVSAGGLMSYGPNLAASYTLAGTYVGRILKGENPANLPVQQSTRFELVINMKTAKTLGIEVPPMLLARADEVIE